MTKQLTTIYRSSKQEGMYLYVNKQQDLEAVPDELLKRFGKPELAMTLVLDPDKKLARTDAATVIKAIEEQGFYLQLPPSPIDYMQKINHENSKLYSQKSDHDYEP